MKTEKSRWSRLALVAVVGLAVVVGWASTSKAAGSLIASLHAEETKEAGQEHAPVVVGTYDSRCLALAYYRSTGSEALMRMTRDARARHEKAEAAGDEETMRSINGEMKEHQKRLHAKGFGTAPIPEVINAIQKKIPQVADETGVDIIVCKWDIVFAKPMAHCVDVTLPLVKLIDSSEDAMRMAQDVLGHPHPYG